MIGSAVPNVKVGQIVGPLLIVFMLLFGGQFLNLDAVTWVFRWIQYLSIIAYSNKALAQNEMNGLTFNVCTSASTYPGCDKTSGASLLDKQGLNNIWLWYCVLINCSIMTLFTLIGALAFSRTTRPLLKLK